MYCFKCGGKISDESAFCYLCGAKIPQQNAPAETERQKPVESAAQPNIKVEVPTAAVRTETVSAAKANPNKTGNTGAIADFRGYVDYYVSRTTDFRSASDMIKNCKPWQFAVTYVGISLLISLALFIFLLVTSKCAGNEVGLGSCLALFLTFLFFGGGIGYVVAVIRTIYIRIKHGNRCCGHFDENIDIDELRAFLSENLPNVSPEFHRWGFLSVSLLGAQSVSFGNEDAERLQKDTICCEFGSNGKYLAKISIRPDSGRMMYDIYAEMNGNKDRRAFGSFAYSFFVKTVPILRAAMMYYLDLKGNDGRITVPKITADEMQKSKNTSGRKIIKRTSWPIEIEWDKTNIIIASLLAVAVIGTVVAICVPPAAPEGKAAMSKKEITLFDIAAGIAPLTEYGYEATYEEVFDWLMKERTIHLEQEGDVAYLTYSGKVTGGDHPVSVVLKMSDLNINSEEYTVKAYSMTLNGKDVAGFDEPDGLLSAMFWAYEYRDDYKTFMDYARAEGSGYHNEIERYLSDMPLPETVWFEEILCRSTGDSFRSYLNRNIYDVDHGIPLTAVSGTFIDGDYYEGGEYIGYDNFALLADQYLEVRWILAQPEEVFVNGESLYKSKEEIIEILGEPSYEDLVYDEMNEEYTYYLEFTIPSIDGRDFVVKFEMLSANSLPYTVWLHNAR